MAGAITRRPPTLPLGTIYRWPMTDKQTYEAPMVQKLGSVALLTEAAGMHNADNPTGVNDAYSNFYGVGNNPNN